MADSDQTEGGEVNFEIESLIDVISVMFPDRLRPYPGRRRLNLHDERELGVDELGPATAALTSHRSDRYVDLNVVLKLFDRLARLGRSELGVEDLLSRVIAHVERRWTDFSIQLAEHAVETYRGHDVFRYFPRLQADTRFLARLAAAISNRNSHGSWLAELLLDLSIASIDDGRILIAAARERGDKDLAIALFVAIARAFGWTSWVSLMAILQARPDYAELTAFFETSGDPTRESKSLIAARLEMARALETQTKVRGVAAMLLELTASNASWRDTGLLARPAETRVAYVESLKALVGEDKQLRRSVIEALLWFPTNRAADLAQFAAVAVADADDRDFIIGLEQHGVRLVQYSARAVRAAKFSDRLEAGELPTPGALVQSLATLETTTPTSDEPARTWLGDRNSERLIESTIARVEAKVAAQYHKHSDEGEDRLLSSLFTHLALRLSDLDTALEAMARAASASHRAAVTMRYRNVDRPEEGDEGIKGAKRFSADLCLIVDPMIDGTSLGRRVTLVQAKRLYRIKKAKNQPVWERSFRLDREQRIALQQQTHSSVYFFHAPPLGGRGVPVIPTQLVADLSEHKGLGTSLRREVVAAASRSLSDWLTYDLLALRVGDPHAALVEKAEGEPGRLPRELLELPTVEVSIALMRRSEEDR